MIFPIIGLVGVLGGSALTKKALEGIIGLDNQHILMAMISSSEVINVRSDVGRAKRKEKE